MLGRFGQKPASRREGSGSRRGAKWIALLLVLGLAPAAAVVWAEVSHRAGGGAVRGDGKGVEEENPNAATACGSGSTWDVKIGADSQASQINTAPASTTVSWLTSQPTNTNHRSAFELQVYTVRATLTKVYQEHDLDQHMSIQDGSGHFMLAELPDMSCINGSGSIFASQISRAHSQVAAWSGSTPTTVQITGVGFFDAPTGQSDQAPNQVELHPVLDINFNPGGPSQGDISGTVVDQQQHPISGAQVSTSPSTTTASTDSQGRYTLPAGPGTYTVSATAPKFDKQSTSGVAVNSGASTNANFTLAVTLLPSAQGAPYWYGFDIARGVALRGDESGGYVLDGWGGIHAFASVGAAPPPVVGNAYWNGWDIARGIALLPNGSGGYVVDGFGGVHPFAVKGGTMPPPVITTAYWQGWNIARGITLLSSGNGYVLDAYGGMHSFRTTSASALPAANGPYWPGYEIARGVDATGLHGGYLVDGFGAVHEWATAGATLPRASIGGPYWPGWNIARGIAGAGTGPGPVRGYVLDGFGGLSAINLWPAP